MTARHALALVALLTMPAGAGPAAAAANQQSFEQIERGRYLAQLGDCVACHTAPGGAPYAGGRPIETPFGTLLGPNITPDRATGIGAWSDDTFVAAVREGRGPGGERLYPAMPYPYYSKMSRDDVLAIRAWLDTLPAVTNPVEPNQLPFPFNIRFAMTVWNALFFSPSRFMLDPSKSAEWNRGAYIVEGPGHCGACHTPKNRLGGDRQSLALQGGVLQGWFAPDLTNTPRTGLSAWSEDDIATYLHDGSNRWSTAVGPMAEVVTNSTSKLTEADLRAIARYLKGNPAVARETPAPLSEQDPAMRGGAMLFHDHCAACHRTDGSGVPVMIANLRGSPAVQSEDATSLIRIVLRGARGAATDRAPTAPAMPAFSWKFSDAQVASVVTYIRNAWGNAAPAVTADAVRQLRDQLVEARE